MPKKNLLTLLQKSTVLLLLVVFMFGQTAIVYASTAEANSVPTEATAQTEAATPSSHDKAQDKTVVTSKNGNVDNSTGAFTYSYDLQTPTGTDNLNPSLSLSYNSQNLDADSLIAAGWSLSVPYIERSSKYGTDGMYKFTNSLMSSVSGELVPAQAAGTFVPRIDSGDNLTYTYDFSKYTFTVTTKTGVSYTYGGSPESRVTDPADPSRVYRWNLTRIQNLHGYYMKFAYIKDSGVSYPYTVEYSLHDAQNIPTLYKVQIQNTTRPVPFVSYKPGFRLVYTRYLLGVQVYTKSLLTNTYSFDIRPLANTPLQGLFGITASPADDSGNIPRNYTTNFQVTTNDFTSFSWDTSYPTPPIFPGNGGNLFIDVNGDNLVDYVQSDEWKNSNGTTTKSTRTWLSRPDHSFYETNDYKTPVLLHYVLSSGTDVEQYRMVDINGDGFVDIIGPDIYLNNRIDGWNKGGYSVKSVLSSLDFSIYKKMRIGDLNGDGLPDVYVSNATGTQGSTAYMNSGKGLDEVYTSYTFPFDNYNKLLDINGDGLADYLSKEGIRNTSDNTVAFFGASALNTGSSFDLVNSGTNTKPEAGLYNSPFHFMFDTDGNTFYNGRDCKLNQNDIKGKSSVDQQQRVLQGGILYNNGVTWGLSHAPQTQAEIAYCYDTNIQDVNKSYELQDMNGDGLLDKVSIERDSNWNITTYKVEINQVASNTVSKPGLVTQVRNPSGLTTTITYGPTTALVNNNALLNPKLPFGMYVVTSSTTSNSDGSTIAQNSYTYEGGENYYDANYPYLRKFAGFAKITSCDVFSRCTSTYFHQGNTVANYLEPQDGEAVTGLPYLSETQSPSGEIQRSYTKWLQLLQSKGNYFVTQSFTASEDIYPNGSTISSANANTFDYSTLNLTRSIAYCAPQVIHTASWGITDNSGTANCQNITTDYTYAVDPTVPQGQSVLQFPAGQKISDSSGAVKAENKLSYENQSFGYVTRGDVTTAQQLVSSGTYITTKNSYTIYGMLLSTTDGNGNKTQYFNYDTYKLFPSQVTDPYNFSTSYEFNYRCGQTSKQTELAYEATGEQRTFEYTFDPLCRPQTQSRNSVETVRNSYNDDAGNLYVTTTILSAPSPDQVTYTYLDSAGRAVQTRSLSNDPSTDCGSGNTCYITTDTLYDSAGQVSKASLPYFSSGSTRTAATTDNTLYTTYTYDYFGRLTDTSTEVGSTHTDYSATSGNISTKTIRDANNNTKTYWQDSFGRLTRVIERNKGSEYTTQYTYDVLGNLIKIQDAENNLRQFTYDSLSRKTFAEDLHKSGDNQFANYTYSYDNNSNILSSTDAVGKVKSTTYDALNRPTSSSIKVGTSTTTLISNTYDTCEFGFRKLCKTIAYDPNASEATVTTQEEYIYDKDGFVVQNAKTVAGKTFRTGVLSQDRQGRPTALNLQNAQAQTMSYGAQGKLRQVVAYFLPISFNRPQVTYSYSPTGQITIEKSQSYTKTNTYNSKKLYRLTSSVTVRTPAANIPTVLNSEQPALSPDVLPATSEGAENTETSVPSARVNTQPQKLLTLSEVTESQKTLEATSEYQAFMADFVALAQAENQNYLRTESVASTSLSTYPTDQSALPHDVQTQLELEREQARITYDSQIQASPKFSAIYEYADVLPVGQSMAHIYQLMRTTKKAHTASSEASSVTTYTFTAKDLGLTTQKLTATPVPDYLKSAKAFEQATTEFTPSLSLGQDAQKSVTKTQAQATTSKTETPNTPAPESLVLPLTPPPTPQLPAITTPVVPDRSKAPQRRNLFQRLFNYVVTPVYASEVNSEQVTVSEGHLLTEDIAQSLPEYTDESKTKTSTEKMPFPDENISPSSEEKNTLEKAVDIIVDTVKDIFTTNENTTPSNDPTLTPDTKQATNPNAAETEAKKLVSQEASNGPQLSPDGLVNSGDYTRRFAPGGLVSYFANDFQIDSGCGSGKITPSIPLPTKHCNLEVEIKQGANSWKAPFLYAGKTQSNIQLPFELTSGSADFTAIAGGIRGNTVTVPGIIASAPAIFTTTADGKGFAAAQNASKLDPQAHYTSVDETNPMLLDQYLVVYGTGFGVSANKLADGTTAPDKTGDAGSGQPISGNWKAVLKNGNNYLYPSVEFVGKAPGFVGLDQINLKLSGYGVLPVGKTSYDLILCKDAATEADCETASTKTQTTKVWVDVTTALNNPVPVVKKFSYGNVVQSLSYTYDNVGNILTITDTSDTNTKKTTTYGYDDLYRLTSVSVTDSRDPKDNYTENFTYSPIGNLLTKSLGGATSTYSYENTGYANPHATTKVVTSCSGAANCTPSTVTLSYDQQGNLISDLNRNYFWNKADQLSGVTTAAQGATPANYTYDHAGSRAVVTNSSGTTLYPSDNYNVNITSGKAVNYVTGNGLAMSFTSCGDGNASIDCKTTNLSTLGISTYPLANVEYTISDSLNSVGASVDGYGRTREVTDYYGFGQIRTNDQSNDGVSTVNCSLSTVNCFSSQRKYIGEEYDADTGMNYLNARYYDSSRGQFISEDPYFWSLPADYLLDPQQMNSYSYARNNPINGSDPTGKNFFSSIGNGFKSAYNAVLSFFTSKKTPTAPEIKNPGNQVPQNKVTPQKESQKDPASVLNHTWDPVSDKRIKELDLRLQQPAINFINEVEAQKKIQLRVTQGYRSIAEQDRLYNQGRTTPGSIVTNARGGESYHNYGLAFDVVVMENGNANWKKPVDKEIAAIAANQGFEWGGSWDKFPDYPHFQMAFGKSISDLKKGEK